MSELRVDTITDEEGTGSPAFPNGVNIDGGNIDGTPIGVSSASSGAFTTLTASDDVNFDSGTLFVDASSDAVGIGTTSGNERLNVNGAIGASGSSANFNAGLERTIIDYFAGGGVSRIGHVPGASGSARPLAFLTNGSERMRITSGGNILLGTTVDRYALTSGAGNNAPKRQVYFNVISGGSSTITLDIPYSSFSRLFNNQSADVSNIVDFEAGYSATSGNRLGVMFGKINLRGNAFPSTSSTAFGATQILGSVTYEQLFGSISGLSISFSIVSGQLRVTMTNTTGNFDGGEIRFSSFMDR